MLMVSGSMRTPDDQARFDDLVDWAISRQGQSGFLFFLALSLGVATGLFIALFQVEAWKDALLIWAWEHGQSGIIVAIANDSWGLTRRQWTAVGVGNTGLLLSLWFLLNLAVALKMRSVPGLRAGVRAERKKRTEDAFMLAGCFLALLLLPFALAMAAAAGGSGDDDDD